MKYSCSQKVRWVLAVGIFAGLVGADDGRANLLENGSFETGDFSGWEVFTTENGTVGQFGFPNIMEFDTNGNGKATKSARFQVGQYKFETAGDTRQGGGLHTHFIGKAGILEISVDVACTFTRLRRKPRVPVLRSSLLRRVDKPVDSRRPKPMASDDEFEVGNPS